MGRLFGIFKTFINWWGLGKQSHISEFWSISSIWEITLITEFAAIKLLVPLGFYFSLFLLFGFLVSEIPFSVCCPDVTPRAGQAPLRNGAFLYNLTGAGMETSHLSWLHSIYICWRVIWHLQQWCIKPPWVKHKEQYDLTAPANFIYCYQPTCLFVYLLRLHFIDIFAWWGFCVVSKAMSVIFDRSEL